MKLENYAIRIEPLPDEGGNGFLVSVPVLPGCMADGETVEQAIGGAQGTIWSSAQHKYIRGSGRWRWAARGR